jgi:hypothetical protein
MNLAQDQLFTTILYENKENQHPMSTSPSENSRPVRVANCSDYHDMKNI